MNGTFFLHETKNLNLCLKENVFISYIFNGGNLYRKKAKFKFSAFLTNSIHYERSFISLRDFFSYM